MNPKEYRLGNLVSREDFGNGSLRIENILGLGTKVKVSGPINVIVGYDEITPIPLTEEWLIKFGFEKSNHIDSFYQLRIINDWTFIYYNPEYEICELSISRHGSVIKEFKYVHQLQNLYFSLTNNELKLSND